MKTGLNIWIYFLILVGFSACDTKQDWFDSGISSPYHDCSIMEYLQKDTANWKLTVELIERAELTDLFEGKDPNYKETRSSHPLPYHSSVRVGQSIRKRTISRGAGSLESTHGRGKKSPGASCSST